VFLNEIEIESFKRDSSFLILEFSNGTINAARARIFLGLHSLFGINPDEVVLNTASYMPTGVVAIHRDFFADFPARIKRTLNHTPLKHLDKVLETASECVSIKCNH
jgi:hypothetical protein